VYLGKYSVRIDDFDCFVFQQYGGDLGPPCIEADADSLEEMLRAAQCVSEALSAAQIVHRFEVYNDKDAQVGYFHFGWPCDTTVKT
jgi:hypothetical protein